MPLKRRKNSLRLQGYDYGSTGVYFITLCCKNRYPFFGQIRDGEMYLSDIGSILHREWETTIHMRQSIEVDVAVIMPNHFHALVRIKNSESDKMPTHTYLPSTPGYKNEFVSPSRNLSSMIRGFKGAVTRKARLQGYSDFGWQRSFNDRIIRNDEELETKRTYILNNPKNWNDDIHFRES